MKAELRYLYRYFLTGQVGVYMKVMAQEPDMFDLMLWCVGHGKGRDAENSQYMCKQIMKKLGKKCKLKLNCYTRIY
jgi:hypothetical protein